MSQWIGCDVLDCGAIERVDGEAGCGAPLLPRGWAQITVTVPIALPNYARGMIDAFRTAAENNPALEAVASYADQIADAQPPPVQLQTHSKVICPKHELPKFHRGKESEAAE